jgi:hypothetical protein
MFSKAPAFVQSSIALDGNAAFVLSGALCSEFFWRAADSYQTLYETIHQVGWGKPGKAVCVCGGGGAVGATPGIGR